MSLTPELQKYHDMGLILIPLTVVNGEKTPLVKYKHYKETGQSQQDLEGLYESYKDVKPLHWAVYAIHPVVGADWDAPKDYETFFNDIDTLTIKTPSGGYHSFLKTLVPTKPFSMMGLEYKPGELCTIIGEGYTVVKDLPLKEISDLEEILKKKMPNFKIHKEGKNFSLLDVLVKSELFPEKIAGKKEDWRSNCPFHDDTGHHFYYYHNTNSWYCFKCKKGGNAVNFIMTLKDMKVKEAVAYIETLLGLESSAEDEEEPIYRSTVRINNVLYEQVKTPQGYKFVSFNGNDFEFHDELIEEEELINKTIKYRPCIDELILKGVIVISPEPQNYTTKAQLIKDIDVFILKWLDIPDESRKFHAYYIMQSWVYEKFHTIGYARVLSDLGTGKTRFLDTIGGLCYKPMYMNGALGSAPIFRMIDLHHGTLIIDEANFGKTDEAQEIITILNAGYEKGKPVIRCNKDAGMSLNAFDAFCPKVLATRKKFTDAALESRCYTETLLPTDREDIPVNLSAEFFIERQKLISQLMAFRLKNINSIDPKPELQALFKNIDSRLIQKAVPLAAIVESEPEALNDFVNYISASQDDLIEDRQASVEGQTALAVLNLYEEGLKNNSIENILISGEDIAEKLNIDLPDKRKTNSQRVGKMLKVLGFSRKAQWIKKPLETDEKKRILKRALETDLKLLSKMLKRYTFSDDENYPLLKGVVSSVSSTNGINEKLNNSHIPVTELGKNMEKNQVSVSTGVLETLETLETKVSKMGEIWQKSNGQINSLNVLAFSFWFCKQTGNGNLPAEIREIAEKIYKITPEIKNIINVNGDVSEVVVE